MIEQGKIMESGEQGKETMVSFIPKQMGIRRDILSMMGVRVETLFCRSAMGPLSAEFELLTHDNRI